MSEQIVYIDRSEILDGKLEGSRRALMSSWNFRPSAPMTLTAARTTAGGNQTDEFVDAREPQLISYGFFINEEAARMTVIAVHPDSASLEYHMEIADAEFRKLAEFIKLVTIEVYGRPSNKALKQLRRFLSNFYLIAPKER